MQETQPLTIDDFRRDDLFWAPARAGVSQAIGIALRFRETFGRPVVFLMIQDHLVVVTPTSTLEELAEDFWRKKPSAPLGGGQ
jgi:hypothetical protein